jgi:hypothetical protein
MVIGLSLGASLAAAQQAAPAVAGPPPASDIKQALEQIKKSRTLEISPATGTDDSGGMTLLSVENASAFTIVVLIVGPTTQRLEVRPEGIQALVVDPGEYEIAVTAVGRDVPPFYGKQTIVANRRFRHKFVIPAV